MRNPLVILIPIAVIVYLTLPAKGWVLLFKLIVGSFIAFMHATKWLVVIAMVWTIICSPHVYRLFGCTPLSFISGDNSIYTDPTASTYALDEKPEHDKKDTKRKRAVRSTNH
jgi:hypothetical protein